MDDVRRDVFLYGILGFVFVFRGFYVRGGFKLDLGLVVDYGGGLEVSW